MKHESPGLKTWTKERSGTSGLDRRGKHSVRCQSM